MPTFNIDIDTNDTNNFLIDKIRKKFKYLSSLVHLPFVMRNLVVNSIITSLYGVFLVSKKKIKIVKHFFIISYAERMNTTQG